MQLRRNSFIVQMQRDLKSPCLGRGLFFGDMCGSTESCCKNGMRQTTPRQDVEFTDLQQADPISLGLCWSLLWTDLPCGNEGLSSKGGLKHFNVGTRASWFLVPYTCPAASYKHCLHTHTHARTPHVHIHTIHTHIYIHMCGDILFML